MINFTKLVTEGKTLPLSSSLGYQLSGQKVFPRGRCTFGHYPSPSTILLSKVSSGTFADLFTEKVLCSFLSQKTFVGTLFQEKFQNIFSKNTECVPC